LGRFGKALAKDIQRRRGTPDNVDQVKGAKRLGERIGLRHRRGIDQEVPTDATDAMSVQSMARLRRWAGGEPATDKPPDPPTAIGGQIKKRRR
jgi:hypothetical protein